VLWTQYPTPSFNLFIAAAILISHREEIMKINSLDLIFGVFELFLQIFHKKVV
jgi:hypothetical protein